MTVNDGTSVTAEIDKAEVYRHAAEVIVRDGKYEGGLAERGERPIHLAHAAIGGAVCALGACARAQYELYGTLPEAAKALGETDVYDAYSFDTPWADRNGVVRSMSIHGINDSGRTSAEDIALLLKKKAAEEL